MNVRELIEQLQQQSSGDLVRVIGADGESVDIDIVQTYDSGIVCIELDGITRLTGSEVEPL